MARGATLLFVAPQSAPFGEMLLGVRIADDLHARGHRIVFMANASLEVLLRGKPFRFVPVGDEISGIDEAVAALAAEVDAAAIVLVDATGAYMVLKRDGTDAKFLRTVKRKVIGLDVWNLRATGLEWDLVGAPWQHSRYSLDVTRRLIPVPFARPTGAKGLYDALPEAPKIDAGERASLRADLGLRDGDRMILFTAARWQHPASQPSEDGQRLATLLPDLVARYLAELGPRAHVVHVSPTRFPFEAALGDRYTWLPQRSPPRFAKVLAASDMLLSFNFSATTIASAIAGGIPVVLGASSHGGATADAIAEKLPEPPSSEVRAWLAKAAPLPAFRVWPLGLARFLAPLVRDNPYTATFETVETLDERAFVGAMQRLLFDDAARAALRERQAEYRATVAKLPRAADLVEGYLGSGAAP